MTTVAYLAKSKFILSLKKSFETKNIRIVEIPVERSLDIDTDFEWKIAEQLMNEKIKKKMNYIKNKLSFKKKWCLVTGATGHLGKTICYHFAIRCQYNNTRS